MDLFIERVGTKDNVADLPSREERTLLRKWGAEEVAPELPHDAWDLKQWISMAGTQHCASSVFSPPCCTLRMCPLNALVITCSHQVWKSSNTPCAAKSA